MAYVPMEYTTGNWHVKEMVSTTPTSICPDGTKTITVKNINFPVDFSIGSGSTSEKAIISATNNVGLTNACRYDFNKSRLSNIYESVKAFAKDSVQRFAKHDGLKDQIRVDIKYHADNTVNGEEGDILQSAWLVFETQNHPAVTSDMTRNTLRTLFGACCGLNNDVIEAQVNAINRGDLDPTK